MPSEVPDGRPVQKPRVALRTHVRPRAGVAPGRPRELRILGDDDRGFIIAGAADLLAEDGSEFWFPTLIEALAAAEGLEVDPRTWEECTP